jgi:hypothetical protein
MPRLLHATQHARLPQPSLTKTTSANADVSRTVRHSAGFEVSALLPVPTCSQSTFANQLSPQTRRTRNVKLLLPLPPSLLLILQLLHLPLRIFLVPAVLLCCRACHRKISYHSPHHSLPTRFQRLVTSTCILSWRTLPPLQITTLATTSAMAPSQSSTLCSILTTPPPAMRALCSGLPAA